MTLILVSRIVAALVCVPLAGALIVNSDYRSDNIFAVPDLIGCLILLTGAALPARRAAPFFAIGFAWMAGVITAAAFGRLDDGAGGNAVLNFGIVAVFAVLAVLYARRNASPHAAALPMNRSVRLPMTSP